MIGVGSGGDTKDLEALSGLRVEAVKTADGSPESRGEAGH